jgi:6-pyruvoyltetrahydropterin/6-carboxytetrahydropterin synthase
MNFGPSSCAPDELPLLYKKMAYQTITRKGSFDAGHRIMNERMKCFNLHGHTYLYELVFEFNQMEDIGYAIDFKEIKRVGSQWIDDRLDHGMIINPKDQEIIAVCDNLGSKKWLMSLNGEKEYCNPSAENISKEIFIAVSYLLNNNNLKLQEVKLYETPNCCTVCYRNSFTLKERDNFLKQNEEALENYKQQIGKIEYDDRKQSN